MSAWLVRQEGSPDAVSVPSEAEVLAGLRNGNWLPTDEVKGPADADWQLDREPPDVRRGRERDRAADEPSRRTRRTST